MNFNDQDDTHEKQDNGLKDIQFDQLYKKGIQKQKKEETPGSEKKEVKPGIEKKQKIISKKPMKKKVPIYKYGSQKFRNLDSVNSFLLLNYKKREKHATKLLKDPKFIKWMKSLQNSQNLD